jgi:hypothetical protein
MVTERVMVVEEAMAMVAIEDGKTHAWLLLSARTKGVAGILEELVKSPANESNSPSPAIV